jgi:hypothetical protein
MACARRRSGSAGAAGLVGLVGASLVGVGLWARRDVARTLARERIAFGPHSDPVASAVSARALAEAIRASTLEATGGRTYSETLSYLGADGEPTSNEEVALRDDRTGRPVDNPEVGLWIQATTLQTALMQAYLAFRLAELTAGVGAALGLVGAGLAAAHRR